MLYELQLTVHLEYTYRDVHIHLDSMWKKTYGETNRKTQVQFSAEQCEVTFLAAKLTTNGIQVSPGQVRSQTLTKILRTA